MKTLKELREALARVSRKMRDMHKKAEEEDRGFTAEEQQKWNDMLTDHDSLSERIERMQRVSEFDELETRMVPADLDQSENPEDESAEIRTAHEGRATPEYREAYIGFLRDGAGALSPEQRALLSQYRGDIDTRALSVGTDSAGGFTVPEGFAGFITETMQDFSGLLNAAQGPNGPTLLRTASGNAIPFPTNDDTGNAGAILAENAAVPEQDTVFGQRTLGAFMYTSRLIRVSLQLLQDEAVNLEQYLGNILGKRLGRAVSPHFAAGAGTTEPTGLVTAATDGAVDISNAAGITYVDLLDLEHALDPAYRRRGAQWVFNDTVLRALKGLNDANNRPLWLPGESGSMASSFPATISGYGYVVDQGMQNVGVGNRPIAFGDLSEYYIREVLGVTLFRFNERYMDNLQIGFMGYGRWDGNLIDTAAVVTDIVVA